MKVGKSCQQLFLLSYRQRRSGHPLHVSFLQCVSTTLQVSQWECLPLLQCVCAGLCLLCINVYRYKKIWMIYMQFLACSLLVPLRTFLCSWNYSDHSSCWLCCASSKVFHSLAVDARDMWPTWNDVRCPFQTWTQESGGRNQIWLKHQSWALRPVMWMLAPLRLSTYLWACHLSSCRPARLILSLSERPL